MEFLVLDFDHVPKVPFILGHPLLATGSALIYVTVGKLMMRAHDKVEMFGVYNAMKLLAIHVEFSAIIIIDNQLR